LYNLIYFSNFRLYDLRGLGIG